MFDRHWEREQLHGCLAAGGLGVVSGRRRHGKSFLLRSLAFEVGALYHQAIEIDRRPALDRLAAALATDRGWPAVPRFDDWEQALRAATDSDRPVIIDEFPYLLRTSPELLSIVQLLVDDWRASGARRTLILCGSSLSVMTTVLGAGSPLHGRATTDLHVAPFDFRQSAEYWGAPNHRSAFLIDSVLGGAAGYRELMAGEVPADEGDFARWLSGGPLNPAHALFTEDDHLLREEPQLADRSFYLSLIQAIAHGATTVSALAAALGRDSRSLHHALNGLTRSGFVEPMGDALRDQRPVLRIVDPIVRFCRLITRPSIDRLEQGRWADVMASREQVVSAGIFGPHFEHLSRVWVRKFASAATLGGHPSRVAPAVLADSAARTSRQLDVVALADGFGRPQAVLAIGEAKYTADQRHEGDLQRLELLRSLTVARAGGKDVSSIKLLLFSAAGFTAGVRAAASRRADVELIDLERLYAGD